MQRISMLAMLGLLGAMACGSSSGDLETKDTFDGGPGGGSTGRGGSSSSTAGSGGDGGSRGGGSTGSSGSGGGSTGSSGAGGGGSTGSNSTGGGLTAHEACKQNIAAHCERTLRCKGEIWLTAIGYSSVEDCATQVAAEACTALSGFCPADQTYHPDKAQLCVDAVKNLECSTETPPAVCEEVCESSSGGESPTPGTLAALARAVLLERHPTRIGANP